MNKKKDNLPVKTTKDEADPLTEEEENVLAVINDYYYKANNVESGKLGGRWRKAAQLAAKGKKPREIRHALGMPLAEYSHMIQNPMFREYYNNLIEEEEKLYLQIRRKMIVEALRFLPEVYVEELERESTDVHYDPDRRLKAANELRDIAGLGQKAGIQINVNQQTRVPEESLKFIEENFEEIKKL